MSIEELCALPVAELAAKDSALFMWATFPQLPEALRLIRAWGFTYKSVAFVWLKKNRKADSWFYGLGFWTRANAEVCLLATKGHPKRQLICFGIGAAIGVPTYLLTRQAIGNTGALFAMLAIMLPAFLLAMYEKDGLPFEKVIRNIIRIKFTRPGIRPYRTENIYAPFVRKEEPIEQSKKAKKRK